MSIEPELSIVIPAFNEESRLKESLEKISHFLKNIPISNEVIIVDDGSTDNTRDVVQGYQRGWPGLVLIRNEKNSGKGFSVKRGILAAKGKKILFTDADLSTPIEEYEVLERSLEPPCGLVIASRGLKDSRVTRHQLWYREMMGKIFNRIMKCLTHLPFQDTQCGFKLMTREAAEMLIPKLRIRGFAFDVEMLWLAQKYRVPVREIPVWWINSSTSRVNPLVHSFEMLWDVIRIRWFDLTGKY